MALLPGSYVGTGMLAGIRPFRTPPVHMSHADMCEIEIEGIDPLRILIADT